MNQLLLELHYMAYNRFHSAWALEPRTLADYELIYILSGDGYLSADGREHFFETGNFLLIPPGLCHTLRSRDLPLSLWCVHFSSFMHITGTSAVHKESTPDTFINGLVFPNWNQSQDSFQYQPCKIRMDLVSFPNDHLSTVAAQRIFQFMEDNIEENISRIRQLLRGILENHVVWPTRENLSPAERIKQYIEMHYTEKITLTRLSDFFYLEPSYISALFKKHWGVTVTEYIGHCRITAAKAYLSYTNDNLEMIAERTGFFDSSHLCRSFLNREGISPAKYRSLSHADQANSFSFQ